ncbi:MAG TPA: hypothetical protein VNS63_05415 [Blastocatellia bacterium]|nr:hypothetical protein [Blastocatellia bacterium]
MRAIGITAASPFDGADGPRAELASTLNLPAPRIWTPTHLAEFLGVSIHWVYKRTEASAEDPAPRVAGVGRLRFDTHSPKFQSWMRRQLGYVDTVEGDE